MSQIIYPKALENGDSIAVTAPSSPIAEGHEERFQICKKYRESLGFQVVEGEFLRGEHQPFEAGPRSECAKEFERFWFDESVSLIHPPWGGEFAIDLLEYIDFDRLIHSPTWFAGYSDSSLLAFAITANSGVATMHGINFMDLFQGQADSLSQGWQRCLTLSEGETFEQESSEKYAVSFTRFEDDPKAPFNLAQKTKYKSLQKDNSVSFAGRLIGGCMDVLLPTLDTEFISLNNFRDCVDDEPLLIYLENCELTPATLARFLKSMEMRGWFENTEGILIGRSSATDAIRFSQVNALEKVLLPLGIPVIYDVDIGHRPPQFNIINGAWGEFEYRSGSGKLTQKLV